MKGEVKRKSLMIVIKGVTRGAIEQLRLDISSCADALREGCTGVHRYNPNFFIEQIGSLEDCIVNCNYELKKAWFTVFSRRRAGDMRWSPPPLSKG